MYADPLVAEALADLAQGLRSLGVSFCVIGALAPELLLKTAPSTLTLDADVTVMIDDLVGFEKLKSDLVTFGFARTIRSYRLRHSKGGLVDLLPYSDTLAPQGILELEPGVQFNMAGFGQIISSAVSTNVGAGVNVPVVPIALYALLKLIAFDDRAQPKDLAGVLHCLRHYAENDDRKFGLAHDSVSVAYEMASAYLLGADGRPYQDAAVIPPAVRVLNKFVNVHSRVVDQAVRDRFSGVVRDEDRQEVYDLFQWYRKGAGI